jgi:biopolymer transport protein ExbB/biopolymer transport protein TolQ
MNIVDRLLHVALLGSAWVLYLLLALSVLSFGAMFERWIFFRRRVERDGSLRDALWRTLHADDVEGVEKLLAARPTIEARIVSAAFAWRHGGPRAVEDVIESELGAARSELDRNLNVLGTLGNNAPFVGLFGTVIGVIVAFHQLGDAAARAGAMDDVMAGIAEALVATGVGLFVAIPAVVAYNVAQKRVGEVEDHVRALGRLLTAWVATRDRADDLAARESTPKVETRTSAEPERVLARAAE